MSHTDVWFFDALPEVLFTVTCIDQLWVECMYEDWKIPLYAITVPAQKLALALAFELAVDLPNLLHFIESLTKQSAAAAIYLSNSPVSFSWIQAVKHFIDIS